MKYIPYIIVVILLSFILLQNKGCKEDVILIPNKVDTVLVYEKVYDTIPGKPIYIKTKIDTSVWMKKTKYIPDTTYSGLLNQYKTLGIAHFSTNIFKTEFKIADYGSVTVTDSIRENQLVSSVLSANLTIPTTTITVEKSAPPRNRLYVGGELTANNKLSQLGLYGGILLKNKKERIYGVGIGWDREIRYKGSFYIPLK
jgi:hypothetical protein